MKKIFFIAAILFSVNSFSQIDAAVRKVIDSTVAAQIKAITATPAQKTLDSLQSLDIAALKFKAANPDTFQFAANLGAVIAKKTNSNGSVTTTASFPWFDAMQLQLTDAADLRKKFDPLNLKLQPFISILK